MSTTGHYDQNLLASAPAPTKELLQGGYTTELLNPTRERTTSLHPVQSEDAHLAPQSDMERDSISPSKEFNGTKKTFPFWRTTKGIVVIIVAILVVLGAVIGGAVGGTRNKGGSKGGSSDTTTSSSSPPIPTGTESGLSAGSTTEGGQPAGSAPPTSSTVTPDGTQAVAATNVGESTAPSAIGRISGG